jgi:hypothetical protein
MTLAELERAINSKIRVDKVKAQEQATFDYILADLIGKSVSRIYASTNKIPSIEEVYTSLFNSEEIKQQKQKQKTELSTLRFKLFANSYNSKFNKEAQKIK